MPTLEHNRLVFRFPQIEKEARFSIDFQRTLRIPDTDETYPLPPELGLFPLRHVEDHADKLPAQTTVRGGVILPMWQAEAMWLKFVNQGPGSDLAFPVAIKVAAGKINAVTGEAWCTGLHRDPQDYMVSPGQPWLDGFAIEKGVIRQFVAMPLGDGYSVEEQVIGEAEWGGLQISVAPLKAHVWNAMRAEWEVQQRLRAKEVSRVGVERAALASIAPSEIRMARAETDMGLAAGGRMHQDIKPDPFNLEDWDFAAADRVFVTLVHAKDWKTITIEAAPNEPPTARKYSQAGLPWFEHFGKDQSALPGSVTLAGVKSLANLFKKFTGATLPNSEDVEAGSPRAIGPRAKGPRLVRTASSWDD